MVQREDSSNTVSLSFYKIRSKSKAKEEKGEAELAAQGYPGGERGSPGAGRPGRRQGGAVAGRGGGREAGAAEGTVPLWRRARGWLARQEAELPMAAVAGAASGVPGTTSPDALANNRQSPTGRYTGSLRPGRGKKKPQSNTNDRKKKKYF